MKAKMKLHKLLSMLLCCAVLAGILPMPSYAWDTVADCEFCGSFIADAYICDGGEHCSEASGRDCYEAHHCISCGACLSSATRCPMCYETCSECGNWCDTCEVCLDCAIENNAHCAECGECFDGGSYCMICFRCFDCGGVCNDDCDDACLECHWENDAACECGTCYVNNEDLKCPGCSRCFECSGRCESCGLCGDCVTLCVVCESNCSDCVTFCPECGEVCTECDVHCPDCGACNDCVPLCDYCGRCELCAGDLCNDCYCCEECVDICEACGVCTLCTGADLCDICNRYCSDCVLTCNNCYSCDECNTVCIECGERCENCGTICNQCYLCEDCCQCAENTLGIASVLLNEPIDGKYATNARSNMTGKVNIVSTKWYYYPDANSSNDAFDTSKAFEAGIRYVAVVEVEAVSPYIFSETPRIDVNVGDHTGQILQRSSDGKRLTIYIDFSICPKSTCIVSFDANGGTGVQNAITVDYGIRFGAPPCEFTPPAGKQFNGWSTDPKDRSGNIRFMVAKSDITFYATWVRIKCVNSVDISFEEPTAYCDVDMSSRFVLNTKNVTINTIEWLHDGTVLDEYFEFVEGETYRIHVIVNTQGEYIFPDDPIVTFNGTTMATISSRSDNHINYYADYVAVKPTIIDSVNVKVTKPVAGSGPKSPCSFTKNVNVTSYAWYEGENGTEPLAPDSDTFEAGKTYKLKFTVQPSSCRYEFLDEATITLIGSDPGKIVSISFNKIIYEVLLTATEKPTGYTLSGTATSFGSETDEVMIQLTESGAAEPAYEAVVKGNSASYSITDVAPGTYTMKVMKNNHVPQEYTVNIDSADTVQDVILYLRGDANMDGKISLMDVNRIIRHLASWSVEINLDNADYDANGKVNLVDVSKLIKLLAGK